MNSHAQPNHGRDPKAGSQSRVLVVDDDLVIRTLLAEIMSEEGYQVSVADDGEKAIDMLGRQTFDMVISDIVMPGLNGVEVLLAARESIPIAP